jgi:glyoxylate/hydroxypyruvate reductase A
MGKVAAKLLTHIGFQVFAWSRSRGDLDTLLTESDVVVNLLPLTPPTRGILNRDLFARMRRGAALVNLARGGHLVEADLLAALDDGQVGHAVLDVFEAEPPPPSHPFWRHPKVTMTPHVAAVTDPAAAAPLIAANIRRFRAGEPVVGLVSREAGY